MYIKIEDTSFPEVSSFIYTEFRRIYGVVFRTSLHGEATNYLLYGSICYGRYMARLYCRTRQRQAKNGESANAQCQEFYSPLPG